ncbi:hypothetical protein MOQ_003397 [Trypanosoma cruzi marinkellei]|uniref:Uncharacterized protein n=1 Tax=Trypanosoma cruzi marinkellei TaxID=85056 RepID=K2N080_TRYCR|nr:hypothetical protein MOQ_003397 [Trypanosoma cruzi marinkellei]
MIDEEETGEEMTLTGAELFHYLTKRNQEQLEENRRKLQEYEKLQDVLQNLTDRCRVPVLAPVARGMAYFEATMDYTNNILVLLGDGWFAERSAKQAREIAGRRIDFLRREESSLLAEASALMQRQSLFLAEVPNAEQAMLEVEASKEEALHGWKGRDGGLTPPAVVSAAPRGTEGSGDGATEALWPPELRDGDLAVIDELDQLTEEELLEIERELGERIEDDELVERIMTERIIAKKEKRVREELRKGRGREAQLSAAVEASQEWGEALQQPRPSKIETNSSPVFVTPGDIGRAAAVVVKKASTGDANTVDAAASSRRRVRFHDIVDVVSPEGAASAVKLPPAGGVPGRPSSHVVVGDVVERHVTVAPSPTLSAVATAPKRKSLFRTELEHGAK